MYPIFSEQELEWINRTRKERYFIGDMLTELNQRARAYSPSTQVDAIKQTMQDFKGLYEPKKIIPNKQWNQNKPSLNDPFIEVQS